MLVLHTQDDLAPFHGGALVPTMGALHAGHASLIAQAARTGLPAVVTIFVNPTQFGPREDFAAYPRTLDEDLAIAQRAGAAAVFVPDIATMYPDGIEAAQRQAAALPLPAVARTPGLEDACRPGHFGGVCQVVARLFDLTQPRTAIFGEKDYQQLRVLTDLVRDTRNSAPNDAPARWGALTIAPGATMRESDGLAMSSRNRYMRPEQRMQALGLVRALHQAATAPDPAAAEGLMRSVLREHDLQVDYAVVRDAATLEPVVDASRPLRGVIAARLDTVRLIDNMALPAFGTVDAPPSAGRQAALDRK